MGNLVERLAKTTPPSTNFEDRTGWTPHDHGMQAVKQMLNPVTAFRNYRSLAIEKGILAPRKSPFKRGLPKMGSE